MSNLVALVCAFWACAEPPAAPPPLSPSAVVAAVETAVGDAIDRGEASVVAIARVKGEDPEVTTAVRGRNPAAVQQDPRLTPTPFNGTSGEVVSFDYGSGVVIGDRGEILTAFHVVKGAQSLEVRAVERQAFQAEVLAADPRSDLAVIVPREIAGARPPELKPLALGDADKLRKGTFLIALGNPFNAARDGRPSASWGILANVARRLEPAYEEFQLRRAQLQLRNYPTLLQLDAKLNLGMSGGAVINLNGELVGVTTALASASGFDAMAGYAIPMNALGRRIVETLRQGKEFEYGLLGITLDPGGTNRVASADPGTPAGEGNVLVNDLILAVDQTPVYNADSLVLGINMMPAGSKVKLKIDRQGQVIERTVELAKFPVEGEIIATNRPAPWRGLRVDYTSTQRASTFGQPVLSAMARGCVIVTEVEEGSPADRAGLKRGQIIRAVQGKTLKSPRDFARVVAELKGPVRLETDLGAVEVD
jgi:S1-C subfamily serine protease